ncbi:sulfurtransferase complex subunit TusC [Metapseudomonas otitidis]|uniref:sulfurtransferase complex subunit TusC n=1 Tax=Metapseudomonas otitidis TaxID=319939 RepID=UPI0032162AB8
MAKSMLIISRRAPGSGPSAREALDLALAGGAFDLPLAMLFMDDGIYQLTPDQAPHHIQQKDLSANLQALPLFGIEDLFACAYSLQERGLDASHLALPAQPLDDEALRALIARHDLVVTL